MNQDPTRILFLIDGLEGDGAERQFCELVNGVLAVPGFEPHVGVLEPNDCGHAWMLEEKGVVINEFYRKSRFDLSPLPRITSYIKAHKIDLVHAYLSMGSEFGLFAGKICHIPVITSSLRDGMNRDWRQAIRSWYQAHFADIAVSNSMAGFASRFRRIRKKFRVIYNGFDLDRFRVCEQSRESLLAELGLSKGAPLVCMAARMEPQKDHLTLLRAMKTVSSRYPDVRLLLAGQGSGSERLEAFCQENGIAKNVLFLGHRRDVETVLSVCKASVLLTNTDIHHEGISNTIIESMALGIPVVATEGGGTDEILPDTDMGEAPYEFGIKVRPFDAANVANALVYLLENQEDRRLIADGARKMVRDRFNLRRFIDENISLYRELEETGALASKVRRL